MAITHVRSSRDLRSLVAAPLLGVTVCGFGCVAAPAAYADAVDDHFLSAAQAHGITFASPQAALMAGHQVCDELDTGRQKSDVANDVSSSSNLDGYHAGFFVGLSIAAFCPRHHSG